MNTSLCIQNLLRAYNVPDIMLGTKPKIRTYHMKVGKGHKTH